MVARIYSNVNHTSPSGYALVLGGLIYMVYYLIRKTYLNIPRKSVTIQSNKAVRIVGRH